MQPLPTADPAPPTSSPAHGPPPGKSRRGRLAAGAVLVLVLAGAAVFILTKKTRHDPDGKSALPSGGRELSLRRKIETLTKSPSKIVWVRERRGKRDSYTLGTGLQLMGLDTRDPRGSRVLVEKTGNFSRPLITPDGEGIVYTVRTQESADPSSAWESNIFLTDWRNSAPTLLHEGYAVDCWQDPATGTVWVYALETMQPGRSPNPDGSGLIRFSLTNPGKSENVWENGRLTGDNIQLNRAGTRASGLIPWPNAGFFDFPSRQFIRYREGCWPSLAPDNSNAAWVFDGSHKGLRVFVAGRSGTWRVSLGGADGISKKSVYHPRWSNHPRMLCFSGPYPNNKIDAAGKAVDIVLGRFTADLTRVESSVKLRHKGHSGDYYPDLWVSGGERESLDPAALGPEELHGPASREPAVDDWMPAPEGLCFAWSRATAHNTIPGADGRECGVAAHRFARIGPRFQMLTDGGWFAMDEVSASAVLTAVRSGTWSMELALTPLLNSGGPPGTILHAGPGLELQQEDADLVLRSGEKAWRIGAGLSAGQTSHLLVSNSAGAPEPEVFLNGVSQTLRTIQPVAPTWQGDGKSAAVLFGDRPDSTSAWAGGLETISFHAVPTSARTAEAHAGWWRSKLAAEPAIPRTVVRARLTAASPRASTDQLGTYTRSWTSALYQKTTLLSGPDPGNTFGVAHWTILDLTPLPGPPGEIGSEVELTLEPMTSHPQMESEHGSEEVLEETTPFFLDMRRPGL
ncbi:MAG: hypothetical protein JWL81_3079 [Verrucomicrobiales bacterium]|nr:hypothetical protein [Verrucomicrobiales bacterium]